MREFDYVLVGGGLQNGLIAAALAARRPGVRVALVDRNPALGSGHTWCFHATDVGPELEDFVGPFVAVQWAGHDVEFPGRVRQLQGAYRCITAERFESTLRRLFDERPNFEARLGRTALSIEAHAVVLDGGERLSAAVVIDARGPDRSQAPKIAGYQKFVGLELELTAPSRFERPLLMDARVPQTDGYRFVYVLPFSASRVLVEDTYFSESAELDVPRLRNAIVEYAVQQGLAIDRVVREEVGVLPLPAKPPSLRLEAPLAAGYQGGWFHPTTGYSLPVAARLAGLVARSEPDHLFGPELAALAAEHARQLRFACLLNRLLFDGFEGAQRWNVFERFYGLPQPTIERFYALATTPMDRARILCGRPPRGMSLLRAVSRGTHP